MEKSKGKGAGGSSGSKKHPHPSAGDLIALGTKRPDSSGGSSGSNVSSPAKSSSSGTKSFSSASGSKSSGSSAPPAPKKSRMSPPRTSSGTSSSHHHKSIKVRKDPLDLTPSSSAAVQINTADLSTDKFFTLIEKAQKTSNADLAENLLVAALKRLRSNSAKEKEQILICTNLMLSVKNYTSFFRNINVTESLINLVQPKNKDASSVKAKLLGASTSGSPFAAFALTLIYLAFCDESHWPIPLIHLWVEDAAGDRHWVDSPLLKPLIENMMVSFGTILPSTTLLPPSDGGGPGGGGSSPNPLVINEESNLSEEIKQLIQENQDSIDFALKNRYSSLESNIESIIIDYATETVHKKSPDIPKNLLKALSAACGLSGVRTWVATRIEQWLHNGKLGRVAQELLLHLCVNSNCNTSADIEVISQVSKLKMKTKPLIHFHSIALREMVRENESNLKHILNLLIYNELSTQRHPNNLPILGTILASVPESRTVLAETFIELLQKREDFHPALRLLLREIVRSARYECDLLKFVGGLVQHRDITWLGECRERAFLAIADLILLSMFLSVSPQVREASAVAAVRGEPKDISTLINFRVLVGAIQTEAVTWLYSVAPKMFRSTKPNYLSALNKVFLKDPVTDLVTKDGWPPESEKNLFGRLCQEVGLQESSLVFILMMGLSKEHPVSCNEAVDIVEHIVCRAATHKTGLTLQKIEVIELLFRLSEYRHPDNISLPLGYEAPKMAVSNFYWRVWAILCVICAFNAKVFGQTGWGDYPTLKVFMEMCMTNSFIFPTASCTETETNDEILSRELQTAAMEKEEILEFETHLAAASSKTTITESNSLLLKQLMRLDPFGPPRAPPQWILTQLQTWNEQMGLGQALCGSRNPDFLLDLIQRNSEPMPWLARLVSEGSFDILPDQCLCEFLMGRMESLERALQSKREHEDSLSGRSPRGHNLGMSKEDTKLLQLLNYLQEKVQSTSEDGEARKVLEYFLRRLSAPKMQQRIQALNALKLLIKEDEDSTTASSTVDDWLIDGLPSLHVFTEIQENVLVLIRQAILNENEPALLCRYLEFLSTWAQVSEDLEALALDVAVLVVERNGIMCLMMTKFTQCFQPLFDIFFTFMKKVRGPHQESYKWSDSQDQVLVTWAIERLEGTMNILIIHAIVILLSSYAAHSQEQVGVIQSTGKVKQKNKDLNIRFSELLDIWFPKAKDNSPKGFLLNTSEEAVLFPDWVKLKMIRSNNPRLLEVATQDLEVDQLILFIQAFGIPVQTMTALLYIMDTITERDQEKVIVCASMVNATLIYNIIQAQWKRGVVGGERFVRLLTSRCGVSEPMECMDNSIDTPKPLRTPLEFGTVKEKDVLKKVGKAAGSVPTRISVGTGSSSHNVGLPTFSPLSEKRKSIDTLSKELLNLSSPPSNRRRSSMPLVSKSDDPLNFTPRRHSVYVDDKTVGKQSDGLETKYSPSKHLGELVDEMTLVEPCIIGKALEFQLPLLFGKNESNSGCRSFLMTALAHQAGWETIDKCLTLFLKEFDPAYDPSSILDLIQATNSNPKLWQGVDKYTPKHQPNLSVMKLTTAQLGVMAEYIVEEISQSEMRNTKFSITNLLGPTSTAPTTTTPKKPKHGLQSRVRQWLQCAQQDKHHVDAVIKSLMDTKWRNPCTKRFIQQVYVEFPEVILIENWRWKAEEMSISEEDVSSLLDGISHGLITALANTQQGKDWARRQGLEYEICLRKLASLHPTLLLRQINLMGSLLEGRVHLASSAFHQQNHNLPFIVFLALFELMQPHILRHFKQLKSTFLLYLKMFKNYGTTKDYSSSLSRFSILLHNFLSVSFQEVKEFLSPHYADLRDLSTLKYYTEIVPLQNLLNLLDPISSQSQGVSATKKNNSASAGTTSIVVGPGDYLTPIVTSMHDRLLHTSNDDEMIPVLQELEALSNRNPSVLNKFSENLNMLLKSHSESCRTLAFSLVLKHSTYFPAKSSTYVDSILLLLEDENADLRETILNRIHEFIIFAQERAEEILTRMFQLGISSNVNFLGPIQKSLSLLRNYSSLA